MHIGEICTNTHGTFSYYSDLHSKLDSFGPIHFMRHRDGSTINFFRSSGEVTLKLNLYNYADDKI